MCTIGHTVFGGNMEAEASGSVRILESSLLKISDEFSHFLELEATIKHLELEHNINFWFR